MNRLLRNSLIIGGILGTTAGIVIYFKRQFKKLADSCYTISGGVIHNIDLNDVKISLIFQIKNMSDLSVIVENIEFNIFVNNMFVTKVLKKQKQILYSNSDIPFHLDVNFNPQDLLKAGLNSISTLVTDKSKLIIGIKGKFDVQMGVVKIKDYKFDQKISLQELMKPKQNRQKC